MDRKVLRDTQPGQDYRDRLKDFVTHLQHKRGAKYSLRAIARDLNISVTTLSRVLRRERHLPVQAAQILEDRFGLEGLLGEMRTTICSAPTLSSAVVDHLYLITNRNYFHTQARNDAIELAKRAISDPRQIWDQINLLSEEGYQRYREGDHRAAKILLDEARHALRSVKLCAANLPDPEKVYRLRTAIRVFTHCSYLFRDRRTEARTQMAHLRLMRFLISSADSQVKKHFYEELAHTNTQLLVGAVNIGADHPVWKPEKYAVLALSASRRSLRTSENAHFHRNVAATWSYAAAHSFRVGDFGRVIRRLEISDRHLLQGSRKIGNTMRLRPRTFKNSLLRSRTFFELGKVDKAFTEARRFMDECLQLFRRDPKDIILYGLRAEQLLQIGELNAKTGHQKLAKSAFGELEDHLQAYGLMGSWEKIVLNRVKELRAM